MNTLATVSSKPALATIDPKDELHDGRIAAGRRVMIPWGGPNRDPATWNANGQSLTWRAIEWATGLGDETINSKNFGFETIYKTVANKISGLQIATRATLAEAGTMKSITAYVGGAAASVRYAIYADSGGQPGALLAQSAVGSTQTAMGWVTLSVPDTSVASGNYWLALVFNNASQQIQGDAAVANALTCTVVNDAISKGYTSAWGKSASTNAGAVSIYATYQPAK